MNHLFRRLAPVGILASLLVGTVLAGTAAAGHVTCGQTITQNTVLDSNVGPCPGTGIIVGANNITLDLNGFTVSGTAQPGEGPGILLSGRTGVTVRNGRVILFDAGVSIQGGSGNTITGIVAQENTGNSLTDYGDGIFVLSSSNNIIRGNTVQRNGIYDGIGLVGNSDNNLIDSNVVQGNAIQSNPNVMQDIGIKIEGPGADNNTVSNNTVEGNGLDGIQVTGFSGTQSNTGNVLLGNTVRGNGFHNKAHRTGNGIVTGGPSTLIERNFSQGNAASGIRVNSTNNTIRSNTAVQNARFVNQGTINAGGAFDLHDTRFECDANVWQSNTYGTRSQPCIN